MAFTVPSAISAFFTKYQNALDVYIDQDGKSYLNQYTEKASLDAKISGKTLYKVDKNLAVVQIYPTPTLKTYIGTLAVGFTQVSCNDTTKTIDSPVDEVGNIQLAMELAAADEEVVLESIDVTDNAGDITMTITTYTTAVFKMGGATLLLQ